MDNKVTEITLSLIRINKLLKQLSVQVDKLTTNLTDKNFWESTQSPNCTDLSPEDYD